VIAGTMARYDRPLDDPLSSWARDPGDIPAIVVDRTQETHGDATPQRGRIAGRVEQTSVRVSTGRDDGEPWIDVDRDDDITRISTDWSADVTGSGLVLAESIAANEELPFPFDVFGGVALSPIERLQVDIDALYRDWEGDSLDIWMTGSAHNGTTMAYHGQADPETFQPTFGLGFERSWSGTTIKGVCYAGGYVALYSARHAADGLQFLAEEIEPYAERWVAEEHQDQTDFDDFGGVT